MKILSLLLVSFVLVCATEKKGEEESDIQVKTTLEVLVIDESTEEPITAAKIKIAKNNKEAYTDFDGIAKIEDVIDGSYDIEISFISYEKQQFKAFQLDKYNNKLIVKLNP